MHTFQRHKIRPRETHSTTRLHRARRPGSSLFLIGSVRRPTFIGSFPVALAPPSVHL
jgi:hypothetical protein